MESSNSGSFQSSSGVGAVAGDNNNDEYDSTTSFFNPTTNQHPSNQLLQPPLSYNNNNTFYNNNPPLQHPGSSWARPVTNFGNTTTYPNNINNLSSSSSKHLGRGSDHHQIGVSVKNPKKRTRSSRRAPTTVLTTDTTNFRQMVQEFTGIPTAPFNMTTTTPFSRRLDLFGPTGSLNNNNKPLRPAAQHQPFLNSNSNSNNNILESGNNTTSSGNYNFGPSTVTEFHKQSSGFPDLENPMFSFQSLLQNNIPEQSNGLQISSSKRWREQNGKMEGFEGGDW